MLAGYGSCNSNSLKLFQSNTQIVKSSFQGNVFYCDNSVLWSFVIMTIHYLFTLNIALNIILFLVLIYTLLLFRILYFISGKIFKFIQFNAQILELNLQLYKSCFFIKNLFLWWSFGINKRNEPIWLQHVKWTNNLLLVYLL